MGYFKLFFALCFALLFMNLGCNKNHNTTGSDTQETEDTTALAQPDTLRFATFNVAMFGNTSGAIAQQTANQGNPKFAKIARIIQEVRPDVLALMEFDYDASGESLRNFCTQYLAHKFEESGDTIQYAYTYQVPSNTGVLASVDLDGNQTLSLPNDAYGFGNFEGQYAFAILSRYPIDTENIRTFQHFLWKNMPNALVPMLPNDALYYTAQAWNELRLSSKNHIDIPIKMPNGKLVHTILAHPTPPVFDGTEDRNGKRNHDEIKLLADYINNENYLQDDEQQAGGLPANTHFVIMGDMNADPFDGDSANEAILQLLNNNKINADITLGAKTPSSTGAAQHNQSSSDIGNPAHDTSFFGLRTDYVLPSATLDVLQTGVFWPAPSEPLYYLVNNQGSSDHLLVWADVVVQ